METAKSEKQEAFLRRLNECQVDEKKEGSAMLNPLPALAEESETNESSTRVVDQLCIVENENNLNKDSEQQNQDANPNLDASPIRYIDENIENSTPKQSSSPIVVEDSADGKDGVVLTSGGENAFLDPNNISPILKVNKANEESLRRIIEEDDDEDDVDDYIITNKEALKRRRQEDSFDDISIISTDSIASGVAYGSAKKPKLIRTGSITRGLRRSMSFAAIKTPITTMLRSRRNSVDPNASISSIASLEMTFNESIKKPVKEKLRSIRDKISKSNKKETPKSIKNNKGLISSANLDSLKRVCKFKTDKPVSTPEHQLRNADKNEVDFKTPIAPAPYPSSSSSSKAKRLGNFHRHSMIATTSSSGISLLDVAPTLPSSNLWGNEANDNSKAEVCDPNNFTIFGEAQDGTDVADVSAITAIASTTATATMMVSILSNLHFDSSFFIQ